MQKQQKKQKPPRPALPMQNNRVIPVLFFYLISFVGANLLVNHFGPYGLWFSSFFLIPFDFVSRCYFQEIYKGKELIGIMSGLVCAAAFITFMINYDAKMIALASVIGFSSATIVSTVFYQLVKKKSWFIKVNGSDLVAICCDSVLFQLIAFGIISPLVMGGQVIVKFAGGLVWYYILFKRLKIQDRL
jgi:queuosine precursor transporter